MAVQTRNRELENRKDAPPDNGHEFPFSDFELQKLAIGIRGLFRPLWRRAELCFAALAVLCFSCGSSLRQSAYLPLTELHGSLDPLRNTFNKDVGKVRLMLLLDPT